MFSGASSFSFTGGELLSRKQYLFLINEVYTQQNCSVYFFQGGGGSNTPPTSGRFCKRQHFRLNLDTYAVFHFDSSSAKEIFGSNGW